MRTGLAIPAASALAGVSSGRGRDPEWSAPHPHMGSIASLPIAREGRAGNDGQVYTVDDSLEFGLEEVSTGSSNDPPDIIIATMSSRVVSSVGTTSTTEP